MGIQISIRGGRGVRSKDQKIPFFLKLQRTPVALDVILSIILLFYFMKYVNEKALSAWKKRGLQPNFSLVGFGVIDLKHQKLDTSLES